MTDLGTHILGLYTTNEYVLPVMVYGSEKWALKRLTWNY